MKDASTIRSDTAQFWAVMTAVLLALAGVSSLMEITEPSLILGLLAVPSFISLMACLYRFVPRGQHAAGIAAVGFAIGYGVLIGFNYFSQLSFIHREIEVPELLLFAKMDSIFMVIEMLGYSFMGLATVAIAATLSKSRIGIAVKVLFYFNGFLSVGGAIGYMLGWNFKTMFAGAVVWTVVMPLACVLLFFYFREES